MSQDAILRRPHRNGGPPVPAASVRVAIYCRKSTDKGLDQAFNSIDSQRECVEAYVLSQRGNGWVALPERYDDGGYTGANTDRPAFQRLLKDVEASKVDVVATYRLDRLSRSQRDFFEIIDRLERHAVTFVSVTEQFNTTTSQGRFALSISMAVAQLEREVTSERTRDKIGATRRRGMWTGGRLVLGYDVVDKKLVVNPAEAERVRAIFALYLERGSFAAVLEELRHRAWTNKSWTNKRGGAVSGRSFDKFGIRRLLTNPLYVGRITLGDELYQGLHEAIVDPLTWDAVQGAVRKNKSNGGATATRNKWAVLLKGIVRCGVCGATMTHQYAARGSRRYSYYVCAKNLKSGAAACPGSRMAVGKLDGFVIERVKAIGRDPDFVAETVSATKRDQNQRHPELAAELHEVDQDRRRLAGERKHLVAAIADGGAGTSSLVTRLGELDSLLADAATRADQLRADLTAMQSDTIDEADLRAVLAEFVPIWEQLLARERSRALRLILEDVTYDGRTGDVGVTFRPSGLRAFTSNQGKTR